MQVINVTKNDLNQRIDNFIKKVFPKIPLSLIYRYIRTKRIKVNDKKTKLDYRIQPNDTIQVYINDVLLTKKNDIQDFLLAPSNINVVYEDQNLLIINKPIGLVVHDDDTNTIDTLINRVKHYLYLKHDYNYKNENSFAPSLVHRLDKNTEGLIMVAKNYETLETLNKKIKQHEIEKYYICEVYGIIDPKEGVLRDYLTKNEKTKMVKVTKKPLDESSKEIITQYRTLKHDKSTSTLEIKLITGKTHQIRAHLAFIGHPLVGEKKYTTKEFSKLNQQKYQQLKAYKIVFNFRTDAKILNYLKNKSFEI